jgi:hypothetical protein
MAVETSPSPFQCGEENAIAVNSLNLCCHSQQGTRPTKKVAPDEVTSTAGTYAECTRVSNGGLLTAKQDAQIN